MCDGKGEQDRVDAKVFDSQQKGDGIDHPHLPTPRSFYLKYHSKESLMTGCVYCVYK